LKESAQILRGSQTLSEVKRVQRLLDKNRLEKVRSGKAIFYKRQDILQLANLSTTGSPSSYQQSSMADIENSIKVSAKDKKTASIPRQKRKKSITGLRIFFNEMGAIAPAALTKRKLAKEMGFTPETISRKIDHLSPTGIKPTPEEVLFMIAFFAPHSAGWDLDRIFGNPHEINSPTINPKREIQSSRSLSQDPDQIIDQHKEILQQLIAERHSTSPEKVEIKITISV
jgi:hypothetical protein